MDFRNAQQASEGERSAQRQQAAGTKPSEGERSAQRQQAAGTKPSEGERSAQRQQAAGIMKICRHKQANPHKAGLGQTSIIFKNYGYRIKKWYA